MHWWWVGTELVAAFRPLRPLIGSTPSERTRAALAAKKAQGARLGNRTNLSEAQALGREVGREAADQFAANVLPIVRQMQAAGLTTLQQIADALNARVIHTARGGAWHTSTVRNLVLRA
jgi:DNA invertase Pin-like site-specific DNA recombinase